MAKLTDASENVRETYVKLKEICAKSMANLRKKLRQKQWSLKGRLLGAHTKLSGNEMETYGKSIENVRDNKANPEGKNMKRTGNLKETVRNRSQV